MNGLARAKNVFRGISEHLLRRSRVVGTSSKRHIHTPKDLPYPIENGVGDFLSPAALKTLAVDYQQGLLQRLTEEVKDTTVENKTVAQTVIETAPDREMTLAFNYASLALNNSFFLDCLKPPPPEAYNHEGEISKDLQIEIREDFGSLDKFKLNFSSTAMGLSASGWVWFVCDDTGATGVIPTFGAGTLLVRNRSLVANVAPVVLGEESIHSQHSSTSGRWLQPSVTSPASGFAPPPSPSTPQNPAMPPFRTIHTTSQLADGPMRRPIGLHGIDSEGMAMDAGDERPLQFSKLGKKIYPLFCVSVYEHAWLSAGYGIWGKEKYLEKFWTVLDWGKVSGAYEMYSRTKF